MGDNGADRIAAADFHVYFRIDRPFDDLGNRTAENIAGADFGIMQVSADDDRTGLDDGVRFSTNL